MYDSIKMIQTQNITRQELKVLTLIGGGLSSKQIADQLHISFNTTETHRKHLLKKFQAKNSAELMKKVTKVIWL